MFQQSRRKCPTSQGEAANFLTPKLAMQLQRGTGLYNKWTKVNPFCYYYDYQIILFLSHYYSYRRAIFITYTPRYMLKNKNITIIKYFKK